LMFKPEQAFSAVPSKYPIKMLRNKIKLNSFTKDQLNSKSVYFEFKDSIIRNYTHRDIGIFYIESFDDGTYSADLTVSVSSPNSFKTYSLTQHHVDQITTSADNKADFSLLADSLPPLIALQGLEVGMTR